MAKNQRRKPLLNQISGQDAIAILKLLSRDKKIAEKINMLAKEYLSEVDIDSITENVFFKLDNLEDEDVWDRSGSTSRGYVDPGDAAWEMFEKALEPFRKEMNKYIELKMTAQAKLYCMAILKGIHQFETESLSQYKEWAGDTPGHHFGEILDEWKDSCDNDEEIEEMEDFISEHLS